MHPSKAWELWPSLSPSPVFRNGVSWTYPISEKLLRAAVTTASWFRQRALILLLLLLNFVEAVFSASPTVPGPSQCLTTGLPVVSLYPFILLFLGGFWTLQECHNTAQSRDQPHKVKPLDPFPQLLWWLSLLLLQAWLSFSPHSTAPQVHLNFPNAATLQDSLIYAVVVMPNHKIMFVATL